MTTRIYKQTNEMPLDELLNLPVAVDIITAGRAFGLGRSTAHKLARQGEFPCRVLRLGHAYRVTRTDLFRALGMEDGAEETLGEHQPIAQVG